MEQLLHICNPYFEAEWMGTPFQSLEQASLSHPIYTQLQFLPLLYAEEGEALLVSAKPHSSFLDGLPFSIHNPLVFENEIGSASWQVESWGASSLIAAFAHAHQLSYTIPPASLVEKLNSKLYALERSPLPHACRIHSYRDVEALQRACAGPIVIKDCLESSGRGHFLIFPDRPIDHRALEAFLARPHPLIGEPWVERIRDFSTQWKIEQSGSVYYQGLTICHNDSRGQYRASEVGSSDFSFDFTLHRKWVEEIASEGFFGNLGIDAMIYKTNHGQSLQPLVEINPRKTMGYVALAFQRRFFPNQHLTLSFSDTSESSLLPLEVQTRNGTRHKFRKSLSYKLHQT